MLGCPAGAATVGAGVAGHGGTFLGACAPAGMASKLSASAPNATKPRVRALMVSAPAGEDRERQRSSLSRLNPAHARENPRARRNRHPPPPAALHRRPIPRNRRTGLQRLPPTRRRGLPPPPLRDVRLRPAALRTSHNLHPVRQRALHRVA